MANSIFESFCKSAIVLADLILAPNFLKINSGLRESQAVNILFELESKLSKVIPKLSSTSGLAFLSKYLISLVFSTM